MLCVLTAVLVLPALVQAGGWAVVTLTQLPTDVVAGQPFTLDFAVRQHGVHLLPGLSPTIKAISVDGDQSLIFDAFPATEDGYYTADVTLPEAGEWNWSINPYGAEQIMPPLTVTSAVVLAAASGPTVQVDIVTLVISALGLMATAVALYAWWQNRTRLRLGWLFVALLVAVLPWLLRSSESATAVAEPAQVTAATPVELGEALFVAKGCISCHQHGGVTITHNLASIGPNLTYYGGSPEFLHMWLADPTAVKPETTMPNLELASDEIETLAAFLSAPQ
jgi:mono/diheme cytochrome c family protein